MSYYGKRWSIDGVVAGPVMRGAQNGQYTVLFERQFASIEQIEGINWAAPTVEYIGQHGGEQSLPEGYGFDVSRIDYDSGVKAYKVVLKVSSQYLGDVTGYQAQVAELESANASQRTELSTLRASLAEADELIVSLYEAQAGAVEGGEEVAV